MNEQRGSMGGTSLWGLLPNGLFDPHTDQAVAARALDQLPHSCCVLDESWRIVYLNRSAAQLAARFGLRADNLPGRRVWDEVPGLAGTAVADALGTAMRQRQPTRTEVYFEPLRSWLEVQAVPTPDGVAVWLRDISLEKAVPHPAQDTPTGTVLDAAGLGTWEWDAASDRFVLDTRAAWLFGLPAHTPVLWEALRAHVLELDQEMLREQMLQALKGPGRLDLELRVADQPGVPRWLVLLGRASDAHGLRGVVRDISARKGVEDSLRESEEALRALADSIPQLAWMANADGYIVWYNRRWYEYTGTTPEQMRTHGWQTVQDPELLPHMLERWRACLRTGLPFEMEFPLRGADGQFRWFLTRVNPVRDALGHVVHWFGTNTDVDQVKRVERALREESNVLELLNNTGAALATQRDLRSLLQTVCDAATDISGARLGVLVYHPRADEPMCVASGADPDGFSCAALASTFATALADGCPARADDVLALPPDAVQPPWQQLPKVHPPVRSYLAVPICARSGSMLGCIFLGHPQPGQFAARAERIVSGIAAQAAVAIDNTRLYEAAQRAAEERKILLENERLLRTEAERASQMKDEFLATLSHELRTPLSSILGWAQVLRRGSRGPDDLNRGLQTIERNARAQAQLIEDLLDMSRITSGKVLLDMQIIAPTLFVDAAIETLRPAAEARQIRVVREYAPDVGLIAGDPARLQQVVWNLLSNAIKFTPRGGAVRVTIAPAEGHVCVSVYDTGQGIRPEFLPHVFERFRQADASSTRRHGGLGLGLSIVKHLVEQHGGTVRAESAGEGQGARFVLEFPLAHPNALEQRSERQATLPRKAKAAEMTLRDLSGVRVLVVDDEPDARELIQRVLSECQAEVETAASAAEALARFQAHPPDVLVSDLGMPEVDGYELLARVRALGREAGGNVPAVALTAFARSEDRVRALESGFWAHIAKPVEPSELIAAVATMVNRV